MKYLIIVIAIAAYSTLAKAQDTLKSAGSTPDTYSYKLKSTDETGYPGKKFIWSIGVEPSIPIGHFHDYSGFGLGGSLQGEIKPGNKVGITINAGHVDYFGKSVDSFEYADFKYWPVMGGLKFYTSNMTYVHGQAGAGFGTEGLGTSFWYGAGFGFKLGKVVDAELRYMGWEQNEVTKSSSGNGGYDGGTGGSGGGTGGTGGGGGYGGHYSTIGLRLAVNF